MRIEFKVAAELERSEGKFAGKDELADQLQEALEGADPGSAEGENGGMYETTMWEVERLA